MKTSSIFSALLCLVSSDVFATQGMYVENVPIPRGYARHDPERNPVQQTKWTFGALELRKLIGDLQCDESSNPVGIQNAEGGINKLLETQPFNPLVWAALAEVRMRAIEVNSSRDTPTVFDASLKAISMGPEKSAVYLTAAKAELLGETAYFSKKYLLEAEKFGASKTDLKLAYARIAQYKHDEAENIRLLIENSDLIDQSAVKANAYTAQGNSYMRLRQMEPAEKAYRKAVALNSCTSAPNRALAELLLFEKADVAAAEIVLKEAYIRLPNFEIKRLLSLVAFYRRAIDPNGDSKGSLETKRFLQQSYVSPEDAFIQFARFKSSELVVRNMLQKKLVRDANVRDGRNNTALISAASGNNLSTALFLMQRSTQVNSENMLAQRAIGFFSEWGNIVAVRALLEKGAELDYVDNLGNSPLSLAIQSENIDLVKLLLSSGQIYKRVAVDDSLSVAALRGNKELLVCLLAAHANINHTRQGVIPALVGAVLSGSVEAVRYLLENKANKEIAYQGRTALDFAKLSGNAELVRLLSAKPV